MNPFYHHLQVSTYLMYPIKSHTFGHICSLHSCHHLHHHLSVHVGRHKVHLEQSQPQQVLYILHAHLRPQNAELSSHWDNLPL